MSPETILHEHGQVSGVARQHMHTLLLSLKDKLLQDGWTCTTGVERDLHELFASPGPSTTYGLSVSAACFDDEIFTVYTGFSSGFEPVTGMLFHDFGLKLVNSDDVVLFETPLQTWQGTWSIALMDVMLAEALSLDASRRFYEGMASRLTM